MRLVVDASTLVAELLRARGRRLIAHPQLDLLVAADAYSETRHELQRRVARLVDRGYLEARPAHELLAAAFDTILAPAPATGRRSGCRGCGRRGDRWCP
ncbi:MAG TPA: PIN domain-containing protein [Chloroflexota bacterium]|nr:PIN domain-containing protein [Chloroflexota bacterium]